MATDPPGSDNTGQQDRIQGSAATEIVGLGPCAACGRDPALGFASIYSNGVERWYCHPDDGPSCYAKAVIHGDPEGL